ncbi:hypothetical protein PYCC9005_002201 [Savitreella phatthalungensis]
MVWNFALIFACVALAEPQHIVMCRGKRTCKETVHPALVPFIVAAEPLESINGIALDSVPQTVLEGLRRTRAVSVHSNQIDLLPSAMEWRMTESWALNRLNAEHPVEYPDNQHYVSYAYEPGHTGENTQVYIVDSGIDCAHDAFQGRAKCKLLLRDNQNSWRRRVHRYWDRTGHGTQLAGAVGGESYGLADGANLVSWPLLDEKGDVTLKHIVNILASLAVRLERHYREHRWPHYANNVVLIGSLSAQADDVLDQAVRHLLYRSHAPVIVPAGNQGIDACSLSPSRVRETIVVSGSTAQDTFWPEGNHSSCVDILAPADNVLTTGWLGIHQDDETPWPHSVSAVVSGTSMAAALTAGTAAVWLVPLKRHYDSSPHAFGGFPEYMGAWLQHVSLKDAIRDVPAGTTANLLHFLTSRAQDTDFAAVDAIQSQNTESALAAGQNRPSSRDSGQSTMTADHSDQNASTQELHERPRRRKSRASRYPAPPSQPSSKKSRSHSHRPPPPSSDRA